MRKPVIVGLCALSLALSGSQSIAAAKQAKPVPRIKLAVSLKCATPTYILQLFKMGEPQQLVYGQLNKDHDTCDGNQLLQKAYIKLYNKTTTPLPAGVNSMQMDPEGTSVVIEGKKPAVEKLAKTIRQMDVEPQAFSIRAEYFEVGIEQAAKLSTNGFAISVLSSDKCEGFRKQLIADGAREINTSNTDAAVNCIGNNGLCIKIKSGKKHEFVGLSVVPKLDANNSIKLIGIAVVSYVEIVNLTTSKGFEIEELTRPIHAEFSQRLAQGESIVASMSRPDAGKHYIVFITPAPSPRD